MSIPQVERSNISGRNVRAMNFKTQEEKEAIARAYLSLNKIGISFDQDSVRKMVKAYNENKAKFIESGNSSFYGMDANPIAPLTTASVTTPVQFLQAWLPGFVNIVTAARRIDEIVGIVTQGSWEDEQIVQGVMEMTGNAVPYGDYNNIPQSSWNVNFETRTIVRFEEGMSVGVLEEKRAAVIRANSAEGKREASATALEIQRNRIGFYGYNAGANKTYGLLNDPTLPAYVNVANGDWATQTYINITADLRVAFQALRTKSQDLIDPERDETTLVLPTNSIEYLTTVPQFGNSVKEWLNKNYPRCRIISCPEFNLANGGANIFYLFADTVNESGSDDSKTLIQVVPQKFMTLGVEQKAKGYTEAYSNATAGTMLKRPYAIVRFSGI